MKKFLLMVLILPLGCATLAPLPPITYLKPVSITSEKTIQIKLLSGNIGGNADTYSYSLTSVNWDYTETTTHTVSTMPTSVHFDSEDQKMFVKSLGNELIRLKMAHAVTESSTATNNDISLIISFISTWHRPDYQGYILDVKMDISGGGRKSTNSYHIISNEGDSFFEKIFTDAIQGKTKAAKKLLEEIIPDIENFIKEI